MIKLHKDLWVIKSRNKAPADNSDFKLSYMTHKELKQDGTPTETFNKRMETGRYWSKPYHGAKDIDPEETLEFTNEPTYGFKIIGSVSRWSTSNKLIRVEDPRGFVVEIPTSNLTTLLNYVTVQHSVIDEKCVWGKEGNNHILLPINSDIYQKSLNDTNLFNDKISLTKFEPGDIVRFDLNNDSKYLYLGRCKLVWSVNILQAGMIESYGQNRYIRKLADPIIETKEVKDTVLGFLFVSINKDKVQYEYKISGKGVIIDKGNIEDHKIKPSLIDHWLPDRVKNKHNIPDMGYYIWRDGDGQYYSSTVISIEKKK